MKIATAFQSCAHLSWATEHGILFRKLRKESCHIHLSQTSSVFETRQFAGSAVWKPPCKSAKCMRNFEILKRQVFWFYALQSCKIFRLKALYWIWRMPVTSDHGSSKFLKLIKNSSSLDKGNHDRDAVRISDLDFDGFLRFCFTVPSLTFSFDREDRVWSHFQALRSSSKILRWASSFQLTLSVIFKFAQTWSFVFDVLSKLFFSSSRTGCANFSLKSSTTEVAWQKNIKHFNNKPI